MDTSSNTAVARATAARDAFAVVATRTLVTVGAYPARIAPTTPVRATVALRVAPTGVTAVRALRDDTILFVVAARDVVVLRCAVVATRDTVAEPELRLTLREPSRPDDATPDVARGFGICSADTLPAETATIIAIKHLIKFDVHIANFLLSLERIISFFRHMNQYRIYSIQQFTAFLTQSPNLRTVDLSALPAAPLDTTTLSSSCFNLHSVIACS